MNSPKMQGKMEGQNRTNKPKRNLKKIIQQNCLIEKAICKRKHKENEKNERMQGNS